MHDTVDAPLGFTGILVGRTDRNARTIEDLVGTSFIAGEGVAVTQITGIEEHSGKVRLSAAGIGPKNVGVAVVERIHGVGLRQLFEVVDAGRAARFLSCLVQRRQQHGGENCDDRDHNQQFDQGEEFLFHGLPLCLCGGCGKIRMFSGIGTRFGGPWRAPR